MSKPSIKYEIIKVKAVNSGNWRNYNKLRNEPGVKKELENIAESIGKLDNSFNGVTRAHAGAIVDLETFEKLKAADKLSRDSEKSENDE